MTRAGVTMEVARAEELAPVKNATGGDSAESCRQFLSNRFGRWLKASGVKVPRDRAGNAAAAIEIAPLYALDAKELGKKVGRKVDWKVGGAWC